MAPKSPDSNEMKTYGLGKMAARHDPRTLLMANYLKPSNIAPPPASKDFQQKVKKWPMMLNDKLGDCTCACAGHMIEQWTTYASKEVIPADQAILQAYEAVSGYKPGHPKTDKGAVVLDVLNYWRKTGISKHQIMAYAAVEPKNHDQIKDAVVLFGNCYLGVQLPVSAQQQQVWSVPPGGPVGEGAPGSWGGHAIPVVAYDVRGLTVITWGAPKRLTWGFLDAYCDEAYAVLSHDFFNEKEISASGFDLATLKDDLAKIDAVALAAAG
jgi:hypothetical protein